MQHALPFLIENLAVELDALFGFVLADHGGGHCQRVADANGLGEMQHLIEINRARTGKLRSEQGGNQGTPPHAVRNDAMKQGVIGVLGIQVRGIGVAGDGGKGLDVGQRQRAQQAGTLAQSDFVKSDVFDQISVQRKIHSASSMYGKTLGSESDRHYFLT